MTKTLCSKYPAQNCLALYWYKPKEASRRSPDLLPQEKQGNPYQKLKSELEGFYSTEGACIAVWSKISNAFEKAWFPVS
jgi:hypothetical protein